MRVGPQKKEGLVKTNQGSGIGKMALAELGKNFLRANAVARLEAAL